MNCKGLLAAYYRASLSIRRKLKPKTYSYRKITKKAKKIAKNINVIGQKKVEKISIKVFIILFINNMYYLQ